MACNRCLINTHSMDKFVEGMNDSWGKATWVLIWLGYLTLVYYLTSLSLSFHICKMAIIIVSASLLVCYNIRWDHSHTLLHRCLTYNRHSKLFDSY